jgi:hypothetical protein
MATGLSSQNEQYLAQVVASGMFPSKEAALDAAVVALREKNEQIPLVPAEHMERVEQAIASSNAGYSSEMTAEDWSRLRDLAHQVAAENLGGK